MKNTLWIFLALFISAAAHGQQDCPCCTDAHRQFDFWLGDWTVYDTTGKQIGENTIVSQEDGCLLAEHWRGAGGTTGRSINFVDRADGSWNQVWIDNQGNKLVLKGEGSPGKMVMRSTVTKHPRSGKDFYNQISWTVQGDGSVMQQWDLIFEADQEMRTVFKGIYRKE